MLEFGTNLPPTAWSVAQWRETGAKHGRFVSDWDIDQSAACADALTSGLKPLCLITGASLQKATVAQHVRRYAGKVARFQILNEPFTSEPMGYATILTYFQQARRAIDQYAPGTPLIAGGDDSGNPDHYTDELLSYCDEGDVHAYDPKWQGGLYVVQVIGRYQRRWPSVRWGCWEFGQPGKDGNPAYMKSVVNTVEMANPGIVALAPYWPSPAAVNGHIGDEVTMPKFVLGFADEAAQNPSVGLPVEDQWQVPNDALGKYALQRTTDGILIYGERSNRRYFFDDRPGTPQPPMPAPIIVNDQRGKLPTLRIPNTQFPQARGYVTRDPAGIVGCTYHYTAGPSTQTAIQVAEYQISPAAAPQTGAGQPFPGLAYTLFVEDDGVPILAWDLSTRVWHSAAVINGVARNASHVGICYAGNVQPTPSQITGLAQAHVWCERQLGRQLVNEGHRDAPYATSCPGPIWPAWKADVDAEIARLRGA